MTDLIKEIRHIGIVVSNMDNSLKFYRDLLGLKIEKNLDESGQYIDNMLALKNVKVNTVKMSANNGTTLIELLEFKSHTTKNINKKIYEVGPSHIAFTVKNLDDTYDFLKKRGVKFNAPPQISPDRYAKVTFCYDPDDTPIELVEVL